MRSAAQKKDNKEFTNLWAGQFAMMAEAGPVRNILQRIIREAEDSCE